MRSPAGAISRRKGSAAGAGAARMLCRCLCCRRRADIGPRRLELDRAQGLDEHLCGWRQGPATKIEHAVSRPHFRHMAVQLDEASRRNVLGQQRGGAREEGVAVMRDQPGVCQRIDQDLRNEIRDARAVTKCRGTGAGGKQRLGTTKRSCRQGILEAPALESAESPWPTGAQACMQDRRATVAGVQSQAGRPLQAQQSRRRRRRCVRPIRPEQLAPVRQR